MLKVHILVRRRSDMTHEQCVAFGATYMLPFSQVNPT
jgi:hypothetical protein